jgi:nucleoside-diphosphate-sugar epimerase
LKYLVTGGAGFIGSALVRRLVRDGHYVKVLDDFSRGFLERLPIELGTGHVIKADMRDPEAVSSAVQGCDAVIHLAYLQGTQTFYAESRQVLDVAVRGMLNLLDACERWGVGELLLVSSSEAYQVAYAVPTPENVPLTVPDPLNPRYSYGGGKIACELMALAWQRTGVLDRLTIARPHNIYGPDMGREHVIPEFCLRMNKLTAEHPEPMGIISFPIQGTGEETRSFCFIDDCISQFMLLLGGDHGQAPRIINIGTQDEQTIAEVAEKVARCYLREIKILPGALPKGSPPRRLPDTSRIETLGWDPASATSFKHGLERTVAWYREHG